jgi:hypothetical protein
MRTLAMAAGLVSCVVVALPGARQAALPDAPSFLAKVRDQLATNALLQGRYTFKERRSEVRTNPFGRIGTGALLVYEVFPSVDPAMTYRRLVERDGQPVPESEVAEQDRAYGERYREWRHELERAGAAERASRLRRQAEEEQRQRALAKETLALFTFAIDRRGTWQDQPAIVVRFERRPGARPRSRESRIASVFTGEAWIHETEYEVMRIEADAVDEVSFGFGMIARLHEGAKLSVTRKEIDGVWLPAETRFTGSGRALMFRKVTINYVREFFDYRPFNPADPPPIPGLASEDSR